MRYFKSYNGDLMDLPVNENHLVFRWDHPECKILFSGTQQGNAISAHLASDKRGLRYLKEAIHDWSTFCFWLFDSCDTVIAKITKPSIERVAKKCGYKFLVNIKDTNVYIKCKPN